MTGRERSRVLLHSAAAIFSGRLPDFQKGAELTLRCGVVYSFLSDCSLSSCQIDFRCVEQTWMAYWSVKSLSISDCKGKSVFAVLNRLG